jgi:cytochrome c1
MKHERIFLRARSARWIAVALAAGILASGCGENAGGGTAGGGAGGGEPYRHVAGGNADRGKRDIQAFGCGSCHMIPGIDGARGTVGPPLMYFGRRVYVAGVVPNTPPNLMQWIQSPQSIDPKTAMPTLGVNESQARDMAAYLYTLR